MVAAPIDTESSLKALVPCRELFDAVQTVAHAVSGRTTLPILSHILIRADENGLRLMATDTEIGITCRVNAAIDEPGALTAPARTLAEVLGKLPEWAQVAISVDRAHTVHLKCEKSSYKILGLPAFDYPRLPEVVESASFVVPQAQLKEMIRQTQFAVSQDESRAILTGILMSVEEDRLRLVATDTHRLAVRTGPVSEGAGSQPAIVPGRAMAELTRQLSDGEGDVRVVISDNQARFSLPGAGEVEILARLIEGQFPNFQRVIPSEHQKQLSIQTQPLLRAIQRAAVVASADVHRVIFRSNSDHLEITAENQMVGSAYEEVEVVHDGEPVEVAFNARYLLDILGVLKEEGLRIQILEPLRPVVFRPIGSEGETEAAESAHDYLCVLMPMQIV